MTSSQPIVDASCDCDRCTSRTTDFYEVGGGCGNCGAHFTVRNRKGDKTPLSVTCPACETTIYGWRAALPAPALDATDTAANRTQPAVTTAPIPSASEAAQASEVVDSSGESPFHREVLPAPALDRETIARFIGKSGWRKSWDGCLSEADSLIEELGSEAALPSPVIDALRAAAQDVVLQEGRHNDPLLSVVPKDALRRLRAALREGETK